MSNVFAILLWLACTGGAPDTAGDATPVEACNGIDDDGDGLVDEDFDKDGDGAYVCDAHAGAPDCNDLDGRLVPFALEVCDGLDNDCDGTIPSDEQDFDADGWRACEGDCDDRDPALTPASADADGVSTCDGDCDDTRAEVYPGADELCDGLDDDCAAGVPWWEQDNDRDGASVCGGDCDDLDPFTGVLDLDGDGSTACEGDCDDLDPAIGLLAVEVCDGIDNDCDGTIDGAGAADAFPLHPDVDADGFGNPEWTLLVCEPRAGWVSDQTDCFDALPDIHPGATEVCGDGFDNDCSGGIDDAC